ncbi:MAG: DUF480 domain-containing protein [Pirellulales bacterium]|nr:DUF480 domain-containing protein [Pirellulales bacterium]
MTSGESPAAKWKPLNAIDRRVLGVLIEKAKTTPDQYPLSLNALITGCNQKSNRHPIMDLDEEAVIRAVDRLRSMAVVAEVQGGGRVPRYRHYAHEWLGVDKAELSIMTELLLRGSQTLGELRTRVSRMDNIPDQEALAGHLEKLRLRKLLVELTPAGRGQVVTHNLYDAAELERERASLGAVRASEIDGGGSPFRQAAHDRDDLSQSPSAGRNVAAAELAPSADLAQLSTLRNELADLRAECAQLAQRLTAAEQEISDLKQALGGM